MKRYIDFIKESDKKFTWDDLFPRGWANGYLHGLKFKDYNIINNPNDKYVETSSEISSPQVDLTFANLKTPLPNMENMWDYGSWTVNNYKNEIGEDNFRMKAQMLFRNSSSNINEKNDNCPFAIGDRIKVLDKDPTNHKFRNKLATVIKIDDDDVYIEFDDNVDGMSINIGKEGHVLRLPPKQWNYVELVNKESDDQYEDWEDINEKYNLKDFVPIKDLSELKIGDVVFVENDRGKPRKFGVISKEKFKHPVWNYYVVSIDILGDDHKTVIEKNDVWGNIESILKYQPIDKYEDW